MNNLIFISVRGFLFVDVSTHNEKLLSTARKPNGKKIDVGPMASQGKNAAVNPLSLDTQQKEQQNHSNKEERKKFHFLFTNFVLRQKESKDDYTIL